MMTFRVGLLAAALFFSFAAGASAPLGVVAAHGGVSILSPGDGRVVRAAAAPALLASGDVVAMDRADGWASVRLDGVGVVQVGPESRVRFEEASDGVAIVVEAGGVRYALDDGARARIVAGASSFAAGLPASGLTEVAAAGARGLVAFDGRLTFAANQGGRLVTAGPLGSQTAIGVGQYLTFEEGSVVSATSGPSFQVGAGGGAPAKGNAKRSLPVWLGVTATVGLGAALIIANDDDDDAPASP